jgi:NhaP-type Na+/H+ or K+/H+ antiporter
MAALMISQAASQRVQVVSGPRGLASVIFAFLALEELGSPAAGRAVAVITVTVLLSVVAHGATIEPLATRYASRLAYRRRKHR